MFEEPKQDEEPQVTPQDTPLDTTSISDDNVPTPLPGQTTPEIQQDGMSDIDGTEQAPDELTPTVSISSFDTEDTQTATPSTPFEPPQAAQPTEAPATANVPSPKKPKRALLIGIIIAVALLVLGGGSAFAYTMYETPQKVITDAIINAYTANSVTATGTVSIDSSGTTAKIDINAKSSGTTGEFDAKVTLTSGGRDYSFDASVLQDASKNLYLKVANINSIVTAVKTALPTIPLSTIDSLVAKINGVWIKVSADELKTYNESASKTQTCINSVSDTFKNDKAAQNEISTLYKNNQFIVINKELGNKDGSLGYDITSDPTITKSFVDGLKTTKIYTALHNCDSTFTLDSSSIDTKKPGTIEIWVSMWSHQLTKVSINNTTDGTMLTANIVLTFNQPVTVKAPTSSTTVTQLTTDITSILQSVSANNTAM